MKSMKDQEVDNHIRHIEKDLKAYCDLFEADLDALWDFVNEERRLERDVAAMRYQAQIAMKRVQKSREVMTQARIREGCQCYVQRKPCNCVQGNWVFGYIPLPQIYYENDPDYVTRKNASEQADSSEIALRNLKKKIEPLMDKYIQNNNIQAVLGDMNIKLGQIKNACQQIKLFLTHGKNKDKTEILKSISNIYRYLDSEAQIEVLDLLMHMDCSITSIFNALVENIDNYDEVANFPYQLHGILVQRTADQISLYSQLQELTMIVKKVVYRQQIKVKSNESDIQQDDAVPLKDMYMHQDPVKRCQEALNELNVNVSTLRIQQTEVETSAYVLQKEFMRFQREAVRLDHVWNLHKELPDLSEKLGILQKGIENLQRQIESLQKNMQALIKEGASSELKEAEVYRFKTIKMEIEMEKLQKEMEWLQNEREKVYNLHNAIKNLPRQLLNVKSMLELTKPELFYQPLLKKISEQSDTIGFHIVQLHRIRVYTQNPEWQLVQESSGKLKFIVIEPRLNKAMKDPLYETRKVSKELLIKASILCGDNNAYTLTKIAQEKAVQFLDSLITCEMIHQYVFSFEKEAMFEPDGLQRKAKGLNLDPVRELQFYAEAFRTLDIMVSKKQLDRDVLVHISTNLQGRILELAKGECKKEDNYHFRNLISYWGCLKHEPAERSIINWHQEPWHTTVSTVLTSNFTFFNSTAATTSTYKELLKLFPVEMNALPFDIILDDVAGADFDEKMSSSRA